MEKYCVIETTFKKVSEAKKMAKILFGAKLVSCAQISTIESLYFWRGKIENEKEFLLSVKTKVKLYKNVAKVIKQSHSYDLPQIIMTPILDGSKPYFDWMERGLKNC
jgi:periplasmic divalent cation tolerance protein